jgi:AcrR family transcriptional regulator
MSFRKPARRSRPEPMIGLRERKKIEKERAIRGAARILFTAKGYEGTTLREVAQLADVGFGTISAYANDKAGLLAMLFVEELKSLPPSFSGPLERRSILDQITEAFRPLYGFWARNPALSRIVLPQMEFYQDNPFAETILQRRREVESDLTNWLERARSAGRLVDTTDVVQAAQTIFAIYTSSVRKWILSDPLDVGAGVRELRYLLELPLKAIITGG